jgi:hypothetical protein
MQDTSSAANHRRPDRVYGTNGREPDDETWFEALAKPPEDTPLIVLIPIPRESTTAG